MVVRLYDARYVPHDVAGAWSELQLAEPTLASPFFRPEFANVVAAARGDIEVAVLDGIGVFPFQRARLAVGRPVGSRLSDYHGLVAHQDANIDVERLLEGCRLSLWEFDGVVAEQRAFHRFHTRERRSPVIDLAGGFDAYATSRSVAGSTIMREVAKKRERLAHDVGAIRFERHSLDARLLELMLAWKSAQYRRTGAVDVFRFPWVADVARRVHATSEPSFGGLLSVLFAGNEPVAMHLGMRSRSVWHWWFPTYDMAYAKYSPGSLLLAMMAESALELGITSIDLGKGDALYKDRFATGSKALASGTAYRPSFAAGAARISEAAKQVLMHTPARHLALRAATRRRLR